MKKILFVTEKYCERGRRDPSNLTNNFHNTFDTCDESELFTREHLWLDELIDSGNHINNVLVSEIDRIIPDVVCFSYYGCDYNINPSLDVIQKLTFENPDTKLVFLWWDSAHPCIRDLIKQLDNYADLHVNFDATDLTGITEKSFYCGVPQSSKLFYPVEKKVYDISFCGRRDGFIERQQYLNHLVNNGIKVNIAGGRTEENLSQEDYARIVRESRININFSQTAHGWSQIKGRCSEILACKTLLLEQDNGMLSKYLESGIEYIPFSSHDDLLKKCIHYINSDETEKIAAAGHEKWKQLFHSSILWKKVYEI